MNAIETSGCATSGLMASFIIDDNDRLYSWGDPYAHWNHGQLGQGGEWQDTLLFETPTLIPTLSDVRVKQITVHRSEVACTTYDGRVFVWGRCDAFETRDKDELIPIEMTEWGRMAHIERGAKFAIMLNLEGQLFGIGENKYGQLGLVDTKKRAKLTKIDAMVDKQIRNFKCAARSAAVLTTSGLYIMGESNFHRSQTFNLPTRIDLDNVIDLASGGWHYLALTEDNKVYAWGMNDSGACGVDSEEAHIFPPRRVMINDEYEVKQIAAGWEHSLIKYTCK